MQKPQCCGVNKPSSITIRVGGITNGWRKILFFNFCRTLKFVGNLIDKNFWKVRKNLLPRRKDKSVDLANNWMKLAILLTCTPRKVVRNGIKRQRGGGDAS